jgi:hypothetical protein
LSPQSNENKISREVNRRVARWHVFKPKVPIWVNFWELAMEDALMSIWSILWLVGIFCGHLVYFMVIWYI